MTTPATESTHAVGPYRLIGKIGEGGMGVVYLARAPDERRVAIKVLRPYVVGDAHGRARLAREVTSLRRVRSPRIAEVYDADPWGETPYLVTRYVAGPSLREVVDNGDRLGGAALARFARGLAEALVVVHRADVLHRDVKPSNVLIEDGEPVLIDFGLAQLADDMTLTQTGWLLGTPGYLAPEILFGDDPTAAADVHAWAATVVFAATGRGPYGSGPPMAVMDRARRGEFNLRDVPPELVDVLAASLRPDPANRPTARQLVELLDARLAAAPELPHVGAPAEELTSMAPVVRRSPAPSFVPAPTPGASSAVPEVELAPVRASELTAATGPVQAAADGPITSATPMTTLAVPTFAAPPAESRAGTGDAGDGAAGELDGARLRQIVCWVSVLCLVVAGTVAAPLVTLAWVVCVGWGLRVVAAAVRAVSGWRAARGERRRDATMCVLLLPWFAVRTLPATLVNALCAAVGAGLFVLLARFGPSQLEVPSLVAAGLVAGLTAWSGPLTRDVRRAGRSVTAELPGSAAAIAIVIVLVLAVVSGLLAAQQITGTSYLPFSAR